MGLFEHKIKQFPAVIEWAAMIDIDDFGRFVTDTSLPKLFMGSGGSYSAAAYAELLAADRGIMAHAMTPYYYIKSGFSKVVADIVLLSASGSNQDITRAFDCALGVPGNHLSAITLQSDGMLQKRFGAIGRDNLYCLPLPTGREGFLSTTSVLAYYILLYRAFGHNGLSQLSTAVTASLQGDIDDFVDRLKRIPVDDMTRHEAFLHKLEGVDSFFILYSPASYPSALDIESKFSEGAIGNTQLADYRNFAHGRFNWFTQRPGQTGLICLQTQDDKQMAEDIVSRVPSYVPTLRLTSECDHPLAAIDLLIKEHYMCSSLAARWGLDLSKPVVPDYGRELHNL